MVEISKIFKYQLYDVWNYQKADNQIKYPGNIPQDIEGVQVQKNCLVTSDLSMVLSIVY